MADEKAQNDQVQDLLARLRMQMSQLDEEFGLPTEEADANGDSAVPDPLPIEEDQAEDAEALPEEAVSPEETTVEEAPTCEAKLDDISEEAPVAPAREPAPASPEILTQIDIFAALDDEVAEEAPNPTPAQEAVESDVPADDDDIPVFSKDTVSLRIQKERIVADETLVDGQSTRKDDYIVTEVELPAADDTPREQTETHASFFVPDSQGADEAQPAPSSASPFAPDRRFDPSRYDEMLAAYEKRKQEISVEEEKPEEPAPALPFPKISILMPRTPIVVALPEEEEDTVAEDAAEAVIDTTEALPIEEPDEAEMPETVLEEVLISEPTQEETAEKAPAEALPEEARVEEVPEEPLPEETLVEEVPEEPLPEETLAEEVPEEPLPEEEPITEPSEDPTEEVLPEEEPENDTPLEETPSEPSKPDEIPAEKEPTPPPRARVLVAAADLSNVDLPARSHVSSGRVHLAPTAYRAKDIKAGTREREGYDDEEDYIEGLPLGIRESLVGSPLGRPNRAQTAKAENKSKEKAKKARKSFRFAEELDGGRNEETTLGYVHHHIEEELRQTRIRLIVISILAFVLLLLENITHVTALVPHGFVDVKTAGVVDMLLLLGAAIAAWPRLRAGAKGIRYGRVLPESILFAELLIALVYSTIFGFMELPVKYFSFVPALGLSILYSFRVVSCEQKLKAFEKINAEGEKRLLTPLTEREARAELRALNERNSSALVYRVRKTTSVKGFLRRSTAVCEDEGANLGILLAMLGVGAITFFLSFFVGQYTLIESIQSVLFGSFLTAPIFMCGVHVYCMHRTEEVAGEDSSIVGEATVREAVGVRAISFEDVESVCSSGVALSGVRMYCDDLYTVFKYLTALYGHIGGPLCGRISGIYADKSVADTALVELVDASIDGVSAAVDGAEVVVGNRHYLATAGVTVLPEGMDGRSGVLYVAVNRMVCMSFCTDYAISPAFEKNTLRLYRLGIAAILRTYDPNFNEATLSRSDALRTCGARVVGKTKEERNDFCAERAEGGIVTAGGTSKLMQLLSLAFRTSKFLRFGKCFKLAGVVFGGAAAILLSLLGLFHFIPSVYVALYHLVLLAVYMLFVRIGIRSPKIFEEQQP